MVELSKYNSKSPIIYYSYLELFFTEKSSERFLFIRNNCSKQRTLERFFANNTSEFPLNICVNKKKSLSAYNDSWKKDFLRKFTALGKGSQLPDFYFIDELLWEKAVPEKIKQPGHYSTEKDYINPSYSLSISFEAQHSQKIIPIESYLTNWIENGFLPICVILGSGGIGKTTILKHISDNLQNDDSVKKSIFLLEGDKLAEQIARMDDRNLMKIETVADLLKFYYISVSKESTPHLYFDQEVINLLVSNPAILC